MDPAFLIPAILFFFCNGIRSVYEFLKEARRIDPESKPVFLVILSVMLILWISWFTLCPLDPCRITLPETLRWLGLGLFVLGTTLAVGALFQLRGVENIDHLVTTGLFKKIRHPMYTGFILWIVGWSVYHGAILSLGIGIVGIADILWWRHLEDIRLQAQFGSAYQQYRLTTWF